MMTDDAAGEIYVADGYGNRRIIVFDAKTGAYKRHWGAYGTKAPTDDKLPAYKPAPRRSSKQFSNPVHCVRLSNDGLVYVCDRANDRIQVFRKDGTFVKEFRSSRRRCRTARCGTWCCRRTPQQRFIFIADGANGQIVTLDRADRRGARAMGPPRPPWPGQFKWVHNIAIDSQGQPLHRRGRLRPPRAEVQARQLIATLGELRQSKPKITIGCLSAASMHRRYREGVDHQALVL